MKKILKRIFLGFGLLVLILLGIFLLNYSNKTIKTQQGPGTENQIAGTEITMLNWNIGYAGLGKDSDFIMDGGENLLPPSKAIVEANLKGIQTILSQNKADFHLFQEISEPDMLTLGVDVLAGVTDEMRGYEWFFSNDFRTQFIPRSQSVKHGLAMFTRIKSEPVSLIKLPLEPQRLSGIIYRLYHIQAKEFTAGDGNEWVILNIHLSAFDEGGKVRVKQLERLLEIADEYYKAGKHVIIGGDWNMQLTETSFPYTTKQEYLFWLKKLPHEKIKPNWQIVIDPQTPTNRSNERPYKRGENYTTIIDGYMVSPNVQAISVKTLDTDFEFTDHQPILARFSARQ